MRIALRSRTGHLLLHGSFLLLSLRFPRFAYFAISFFLHISCILLLLLYFRKSNYGVLLRYSSPKHCYQLTSFSIVCMRALFVSTPLKRAYFWVYVLFYCWFWIDLLMYFTNYINIFWKDLVKEIALTSSFFQVNICGDGNTDSWETSIVRKLNYFTLHNYRWKIFI